MQNCKTFKELKVGDYFYDMVATRNIIYKNKITSIQWMGNHLSIYGVDNHGKSCMRSIYDHAINDDICYDWGDPVSTSLEKLFDEVIKNLNHYEFSEDIPFR